VASRGDALPTTGQITGCWRRFCPVRRLASR